MFPETRTSLAIEKKNRQQYTVNVCFGGGETIRMGWDFGDQDMYIIALGQAKVGGRLDMDTLYNHLLIGI